MTPDVHACGVASVVWDPCLPSGRFPPGGCVGGLAGRFLRTHLVSITGTAGCCANPLFSLLARDCIAGICGRGDGDWRRFGSKGGHFRAKDFGRHAAARVRPLRAVPAGCWSCRRKIHRRQGPCSFHGCTCCGHARRLVDRGLTRLLGGGLIECRSLACCRASCAYHRVCLRFSSSSRCRDP